MRSDRMWCMLAVLGGVGLGTVGLGGCRVGVERRPGPAVGIFDGAVLEAAAAAAAPGEVVVIADGVYDEPIVLRGRGTRDRPVVIRPATPGGVTLRGPLEMAGAYLVLDGVGFAGEGWVRIDGTGLRLTRCTMSDVRAEKWVRVESTSREVEIDHCLFENKLINRERPRNCQLMQVRVLNRGERHHIHHNHFRDVPEGASPNGFETLQVITEGNPWDPDGDRAEVVVEHNLFERCNGEAEIISIKANGCTVRSNTFRACRGELVLRHGDACVASGNWFLGEGEPRSGGVRLQGADQTVVNNVFAGLGSFAVAMMDGAPDDLYIRVERATVMHNTVVDCAAGLVVGMTHSSFDNGTAPRACVIGGNIFDLAEAEAAPGEAAGADPRPVVVLVHGDDPEAWVWIDNTYRGEPGVGPLAGPLAGLLRADPALGEPGGPSWLPTASTPKTDFAIGGVPAASKDIVGTRRPERRTAGAIELGSAGALADGSGPLTAADVGPGARVDAVRAGAASGEG